MQIKDMLKRRNLKKLIVHPFLFIIFPILALYVQNIDEVYLSEILLPLLIALLFIAVTFFVGNLFVKNAKKTALILSIGIVIAFIYNAVYTVLFNLFYKSYNFFWN